MLPSQSKANELNWITLASAVDEKTCGVVKLRYLDPRTFRRELRG
jgi:hypothetical protein